jgi:SanA protein
MATLRRLFSTLSRVFLRGIWCTALLLGIANWAVLTLGNKRIVHDPSQLPPDAAAVVLGTSPRSLRGGPSPFFEGRMDAAAKLYHSNAVRRFVLSGDNRRAEYNEPAAMRESLRQRGVPDSALVLDPAGYRTLESILRARSVFRLQSAVIITDDFHLPRALFLCAMTNFDAVGYAAQSVPWSESYRARFRETFSRALALWEIYTKHSVKAASPEPTTPQ